MNGDFNVELLRRVAECEDFILILDANVFKGTLEGREKQKDSSGRINSDKLVSW